MKIVGIVFLLITLSTNSGCSANRKIEVDQTKVPLNLHDPEPLAMSDINFRVLTTKNYLEVLDKARNEPVMFCLDGTDYKNLSTNFSSTINYIVLQKELITKYREYYETKPEEKEPEDTTKSVFNWLERFSIVGGIVKLLIYPMK